MDSTQYGGTKSTQNIPPLGTMSTFGTLQYSDGHNTAITPDITGTIDKGFFLSENEWTCYRRNYFSCLCYFNISPYYPNVPVTFQANGSSTLHHVASFAMSISAVVADTDGQKIELVQHTPKRDKGPITTPDKIRMAPKAAQPASHHAGLGMFGSHTDPTGAAMGTRNIYESGYGQGPPPGPATEHAFERIQFKQATANNGKRRAAQQYYHLLVELWVDVGNADHTQWIKVAQRKSAKMIVRGRSPGHYQAERRSSTSSGPGGSGGALGYGNGVMGSDFNSGPGSILGSGYSPYDPRSASGGYGVGGRHHAHVDVSPEPDVSAEDAKGIEAQRGFRIFSTAAYDGSTGRVGQYPSLSRADTEATTSTEATSAPATTSSGNSIILPHMSTETTSSSRLKSECDSPLPSFGYPGPSYAAAARCGPYVSKGTNGGYYPAMLPTLGLNIT